MKSWMWILYKRTLFSNLIFIKYTCILVFLSVLLDHKVKAVADVTKPLFTRETSLVLGSDALFVMGLGQFPVWLFIEQNKNLHIPAPCLTHAGMNQKCIFLLSMFYVNYYYLEADTTMCETTRASHAFRLWEASEKSFKQEPKCPETLNDLG